MAVPGYQEFIYPFLKQLEDGKEYRLQDLYEILAKHFGLTEEDIAENFQVVSKR